LKSWTTGTLRSRLGDAGTEIVELALPAVVTVDVSINEPRLPQMRGIMMAKKKPIQVMNLAALGTSPDEVGGGTPRSEIVEFMAPETRKGGRKFEGDAAEITARVVDLLANEAKVFDDNTIIIGPNGFILRIMAKVLVIADIKQGVFKGSTAELLSKAKAIGAETAVVAIGSNIESLIPEPGKRRRRYAICRR
jgi:hypothetical protein